MKLTLRTCGWLLPCILFLSWERSKPLPSALIQNQRPAQLSPALSPRVESSQPTTAQVAAPDEFQRIAKLSRYRLPTQATKEELLASLSEESLQESVWIALRQGDQQSFTLAEEKQRMNAVSIVGLIARYKDVKRRDQLLQKVQERILDVDFSGIRDLRQKQSIYGDITELLYILKTYDPAGFLSVASEIVESHNMILRHALNSSS